jgi:hypothetical protein
MSLPPNVSIASVAAADVANLYAPYCSAADEAQIQLNVMHLKARFSRELIGSREHNIDQQAIRDMTRVVLEYVQLHMRTYVMGSAQKDPHTTFPLYIVDDKQLRRIAPSLSVDDMTLPIARWYTLASGRGELDHAKGIVNDAIESARVPLREASEERHREQANATAVATYNTRHANNNMIQCSTCRNWHYPNRPCDTCEKRQRKVQTRAPIVSPQPARPSHVVQPVEEEFYDLDDEEDVHSLPDSEADVDTDKDFLDQDSWLEVNVREPGVWGDINSALQGFTTNCNSNSLKERTAVVNTIKEVLKAYHATTPAQRRKATQQALTQLMGRLVFHKNNAEATENGTYVGNAAEMAYKQKDLPERLRIVERAVREASAKRPPSHPNKQHNNNRRGKNKGKQSQPRNDRSNSNAKGNDKGGFQKGAESKH